MLAWAHKLGMCYKTKYKSYYVDRHEQKDVLAYSQKVAGARDKAQASPVSMVALY